MARETLWQGETLLEFFTLDGSSKEERLSLFSTPTVERSSRKLFLEKGKVFCVPISFQFSFNSFKKVIKGWEVGIVGMKKEEKRAIVIPPSFGYGNQTVGPIPANSVLIFEVNLKKTKRGARAEDALGEDSLPAAVFPGAPSPNNKASVIERMKRLGAQAAIPSPSGPTVEDEEDDFGDDMPSVPAVPQDTVVAYVAPEESEEAKKLREQMELMKQQMEQLKKEQDQIAEEKRKKEQEELRKQEERLREQKEQLLQEQMKEQLRQEQIKREQMQQNMLQMQVAPVNNSPVNPVQQYIETTNFQKNMSQLVEQMFKKITSIEDRIEKSFIGTSSESGTVTLSSTSLIKTIKKMVDENEKMRTELADKIDKIELMRERVTTLHEKNEKLIDENNSLMEKRNDSVKEQAESARSKMRALLSEKEELESDYNSLQEKMGKAKKKFMELTKSYSALKEEAEYLREEKDKQRLQIESLQSAKTSFEAKIENLTEELKSEREAKREASKAAQALRDDLLEEQAEVKRLKESLQERKQKHEESVARIQALHDDEKATLRKEIASLEKLLREERQASGSLTEEQAKKFEEREKKIVAQHEQSMSLALESLKKELSEKFAVEKSEAEKAAFSEGKSEGKKALQFSLDSANDSAQKKISGLQQEVAELSAKENKLSFAQPSKFPL